MKSEIKLAVTVIAAVFGTLFIVLFVTPVVAHYVDLWWKYWAN